MTFIQLQEACWNILYIILINRFFVEVIHSKVYPKIRSPFYRDLQKRLVITTTILIEVGNRILIVRLVGKQMESCLVQICVQHRPATCVERSLEEKTMYIVFYIIICKNMYNNVCLLNWRLWVVGLGFAWQTGGFQ